MTLRWPDGTPLSRRAARRVIVIALPPAIVWAFFSTLVREIRSAFYYAYLEVRICCSDARRDWRGESR